jgi:tRNA dimethylallyltransferase
LPGFAYALLGPTASGKSGLALALSKQVQLEIVSIDSAQVYRGMDIGTAKPTAAERAAVPHHLIDLIDPDQAYSAGQWREAAIHAVTDILGRQKVPLLVGGTMLYYRGLIAGLDALPPADTAVRAEIDAEAAKLGWPAVHAELAKVDPVTAKRLPRNDAQRIQRALEVFRLTGTPLSDLQGRSKSDLPFQVRAFALFPERETLHRNIAARFDDMLSAGLVEEVKTLRRKFKLAASMPSMRTVGYRQVWELLEGETDEKTMRERGIAATRQLAKRQMTWLRSFPDLLRLDAGGAQSSAVALKLLLDQIGQPLGRAGR